MRALFLSEDAARAGPGTVTVVAVSPLLSELILRRASSRWMWDEAGPVRTSWRSRCTRLAMPRHARLRCRVSRSPATARYRGAAVRSGRSARAGIVRRDRWRLGAHPGAAVSPRDRHELPNVATPVRLTEALACLAQGATPARAAAAVGYNSGPAFGAAFRAAFGTTPGRSR